MANLIKRHWYWLVPVAALGCLAAFLAYSWLTAESHEPDGSPPEAFQGKSSLLQHTAVVSTLDSPAPANKSIVWCSSFQLAWDRLKQDAAGGPVKVENAEAIADRLNGGAQSEADLPRGAFFAAAGRVSDGIIQKIQTEMAKRFPDAPRPDLAGATDGVIAYSYLQAGTRFRHPFFENDKPLLFTDSTGKQSAVRSFGVRKQDDYAYHKLREQIAILYCPQDAVWQDREVEEFVLDPCKYSSPHQIILARIERKPTLAEMVADVESKIKDKPTNEFTGRFHVRDTLLIPDIHFRIDHEFQELQGEDKKLLNPPLAGLYLARAAQMIDFKLGRGGAELASEAKVYVKPGASFFHFNRPFLLYLKKRGAQHPFFAVWVDNSELLCK